MKRLLLSLAVAFACAPIAQAQPLKVDLPKDSPEAIALMKALVDAHAIITPGKDGIAITGHVACKNQAALVRCEISQPNTKKATEVSGAAAKELDSAFMAAAQTRAELRTPCLRGLCASFEASDVSCVESITTGTRCSFSFDF